LDHSENPRTFYDTSSLVLSTTDLAFVNFNNFISTTNLAFFVELFVKSNHTDFSNCFSVKNAAFTYSLLKIKINSKTVRNENTRSCRYMASLKPCIFSH
ncbi:hypothetical protein ALC62_07046, partial [Cyphomyrmex costatus]